MECIISTLKNCKQVYKATIKDNQLYIKEILDQNDEFDYHLEGDVG